MSGSLNMSYSKRSFHRTPRGYDGTATTIHSISDLLPEMLSKIDGFHQQCPHLIIEAWPEIIGSRLATMTQALSFVDGVLTVRVNNSTLYSLLNQYERQRIINALRNKFPQTNIKTVVFRIV